MQLREEGKHPVRRTTKTTEPPSQSLTATPSLPITPQVMVGVVRFGDMLLALIGVVVVTVYAVPSLLIAMVRKPLGGGFGSRPAL